MSRIDNLADSEFKRVQRDIRRTQTASPLVNASVTRGRIRIASDEGLLVEGSQKVDGTIHVVGENAELRVEGVLTVTGPASYDDDLDITGDTDIGGRLGITGDTTIGGQLDITGDATVRESLDVEGNLRTRGRTDLGGQLYIPGAGMTNSLDSVWLVVVNRSDGRLLLMDPNP